MKLLSNKYKGDMNNCLITLDSKTMADTTKVQLASPKSGNLELTACPAYSSQVGKCFFQAVWVAALFLRKVTFFECVSQQSLLLLYAWGGKEWESLTSFRKILRLF